MNVGFHSNQLGIRGTEVSLYDYAHYNEAILGNTSYVFAPANSDLAALDKFRNRFQDRVILYNSFSEVGNYKIDVAFLEKAGHYDGILFPRSKNIVHAVFEGSDKHGDVYIAISEWLGNRHNIDFLPYIVTLPDVKEDFRDYIGIPKEAIVFGRHGGNAQFDIPYLADVLCKLAEQGYWFLLLNTNMLRCQHPRIVYIEPTTDLHTKTAFINTCDAMIHGRSEGESFGLAVSEFLHQNKPVVTNLQCRDKNQMYILKDKGFYYENPNELYNILLSIEKKDYNVKPLVEKFKPETVMQKFNYFLNL